MCLVEMRAGSQSDYVGGKDWPNFLLLLEWMVVAARGFALHL